MTGRREEDTGADEPEATRPLPDPRRRSERDRLHAEILEQLAPATEGRRVNPERARRGRLVFGDAVE